jgi:hypothetical protein
MSTVMHGRPVTTADVTATVFADNAEVIGLIMSILVWVSPYTAYL